jgi:antirestriction protein ArdC
MEAVLRQGERAAGRVFDRIQAGGQPQDRQGDPFLSYVPLASSVSRYHAIFAAASHAQRATDFLHGLQATAPAQANSSLIK